MNNSELTTEQVIIEAAEAEFMDKGYGSTKMLAIAQRAGVSHSMLHYYFRTKDNLFQTIFSQKVQMISQLYEGTHRLNLPFFDMVRRVVEVQFEFIRQNPKLPHFFLHEFIANEANRKLLIEMHRPKIAGIFTLFEARLKEEIAQGNVRPISMRDFVMNIVSLNISMFVFLPILQETMTFEDEAALEKLLLERRESNVQYVLHALRPDPSANA